MQDCDAHHARTCARVFLFEASLLRNKDYLRSSLRKDKQSERERERGGGCHDELGMEEKKFLYFERD